MIRDRLLMHTVIKFRMPDWVCYGCANLDPVSLKGKCYIFCSCIAVQNRIHKIAVYYDRQKCPILSVKINQNPSDSWVVQLMVYKCSR